MGEGGTRRIGSGTVLATIFMGVVVLIAMIGRIGAPPNRDSTSREWVRLVLEERQGPPLMLPEVLPDGWDPGVLRHEWATVEMSELDPVDEPPRPGVIAHTMSFWNERTNDGMLVCTQLAAETRQACVFDEEDPQLIERRLDEVLVVIRPAADRGDSIEEWRSIPLTTDLDRVTWMH